MSHSAQSLGAFNLGAPVNTSSPSSDSTAVSSPSLLASPEGASAPPPPVTIEDEFHPAAPHDDLHPLASGNHPADERRRDEKLAEGEKDIVRQDGAAIPSGMFFPSGVGMMDAVPPVLTSAADLHTTTTDPEKEAAIQAAVDNEQAQLASSSDVSRDVSRRETSLDMSEKPPQPLSSSHSSSSESSLVKPKKRFNFSRSRKAKDTADKKSKDKDKEAAAVPPVGFIQLFRFATPTEKILDIVGLFLAAAAGAAQPLMTLIFSRLTNSFTNYGIIATQIAQQGLTPATYAQLEAVKHELKVDSGRNALYLVAIGVGMFAATWSYMFIWNFTGEVNAKRVRESYLRSVLRQEIAYFDDLGAGEVATRIETDCHLVQDGTSERVPLVCQYLGTFVCGFVLAYVRSWRLALALSSILPMIITSFAIMMTAMSKYSTQSLEAIAKAGSLAEEAISSIRTMHAFGMTRVLGVKFNEYIEKSRLVGRKGAFVEAGGLAAMFFSIYSAWALTFFYGGILVTQGRANVGVVINVFMSILIGSFSMAMMAPEMAAITKARGAAAKLFQTIDRVPAIDSADTNGLKPEVVMGSITFENVRFHYPSRTNVPILKGLTTNFRAGNTVALVGASGSGKSTVVALIERFYDPIQGVIKLDGRDIKTLNLKWLRQQIGLVSQEPTLFATTVRGNVEHGLIGSPWAHVSDAEKFELVQKACINANAHDFILKLPHGYDTMVGERGMLLSGGQKQRLAIARAIVSDPRILLLDEATSALDTQSEGIVQDALDKASKGRTTITIAHRLSTIKDADLILVMGGGEILEQGTHDSLLANENGPYGKLVSNQKLIQVSDLAPPEDQKLDDIPLGSPTGEKFPEMQRALTGRSLASAAMEDVQARREVGAAADEDIPSAWRLYGRLLRLNKDQKWEYIVGGLAATASGLVYPALSILFGKALTDFQITNPADLRHQLTEKSRYYFITAVLAAIAIYLQSSFFVRTGWDLNAKLRRMVFASTMRHDIEWFDEEKNSTGALTSNLADLPQRVQGLFGATLGTVVQSIATLVGGCIIGLSYGPLLAIIGIGCIPLLVSGGYIRLQVVTFKDRKMKKNHAASAQMAAEAASAVRTVASLTREDDVDQMYSKSLEGPMRTSIRTSLKSQALFAASQGVTFLIIALVFYVGALWIISARYATATFFTVLTSVIFASIQAGNVFNFVPDASKANGASAAIFRLIDNEPEIDALSTEGIQLDPAQVNGHVRLEGIHFRYPSRPDVRVLRELTIDVPPGTYIALVGPSGCGKSTTIQMLERFYDPLFGRVTLDGVDIKDINVSSYRSQLALVSQEPTLYMGTIRFNILLGANKPMDEVSEEDIIRAAKDANIYDFIMSLPDGFETEVGGRGSQLSGGQKQRIAIARALIRNPKVLLLDEATSALDSQSERVVQEALDKAARGRTTIAIAHRLSTIQKADIIYCFAEGKVAEKGTHAELLAQKGPYYDLVQMQNLSRR